MKAKRHRSGFTRAATLMSERIKSATQTRGFTVSRLLTHWEEIAGPDLASISRPVEVSYGRGFGATLCILTTGANAPLLEMQKPKLRERVNSVYGYNAISSIRITQTHATGFAEGQVSFQHRAKTKAEKTPDPEIKADVAARAQDVRDDSLRSALEALGQNVLTKQKRK